MEGLDFDLDNILDEEDMTFISGDKESQENDTQPEEKEGKDEKDDKNTTESTLDDEFINEEDSEGVGSEDNNEGQEGANLKQGKGDSPTKFFSSIAKACAEEGILPNLDEETINKIETPEDLRKAIEEQIKSELSEQQKRVTEALNYDVKPNVVREFENTLSYLDSIDEETLNDESEDGEGLRTRLLYQDYINRGFSQARAEREVKKAIDNGTDIDDAKEALESLKSFYGTRYQRIIEDAKARSKAEQNQRNMEALNFRNKILDEKNKFFDELEVDKGTRQRIFDNISKPTYKDPDTGAILTALQKYQKENTEEFIINVGVLYTLTNEFKDLGKLTSTKVKKEIKKGFRDLENRINNTSRDSYGNLKFTSGADGESYFSKGLDLNI